MAGTMDSMRSPVIAADQEAPARTAALYGVRDLGRIFGGGAKAPVPWRQAIQNKHRKMYSPDIVHHALSQPISPEHGLVPVDPRHLQATQPHLFVQP